MLPIKVPLCSHRKSAPVIGTISQQAATDLVLVLHFLPGGGSELRWKSDIQEGQRRYDGVDARDCP